ncbi:hypothetical protein ILYODFUR_036769 [Ilyodon furcidens]|uniref:Uncharacterized protein n=1 Tax=Ilyodon furcidens TaxID=33524 RepID=A0ABV0UR53_9TELE
MRGNFFGIRISKAPALDGVPTSALKPALTNWTPASFIKSLGLCEVPSRFKCSTVIAVPNPNAPSAGEGHHRSPAGALAVCLLDSRSADNAVNVGVHFIQHHLAYPGTYPGSCL